MPIKTNLHLHTADDPKDKIPYSTYQAIDCAAANNFGCLAITCHEKYAYKKEYADYAKARNILLIPGIEARIENKDVVILNCGPEAEKIKTFGELQKYKNENPQIFILAPHPFVWSKKSLGEKLAANINIFDAIELTVFSNNIFNFNKKALRLARKYNKVLIATSDTHRLKDINRGYVLVDTAEKTPGAIFESIKKSKIENKNVEMNPIPMALFLLSRILSLFKNLS